MKLSMNLLCFLLSLSGIIAVRSQVIVGSSECSFSCPTSSDASYQTYCCSDSGSEKHYYCCNPYLELYIGLGIGVPIIVTLIAVVIVLYCCWWRHNRKKRRRLMQLYIATRLTVRDDEDAPPLYRDNELPEYTEEDPYKSLKAQEVVGVVSEGNVTDDDRETLIQDDNPTTV